MSTPKAYIVVTEKIHDPEGMAAYSAAARPSIATAGLTALAVDANPRVLEGSDVGRIIIMEFESAEAAAAWYDSEEYQAAVTLRLAAADCTAFLVNGLG